ncbi:MAG: hypothetical protein KF768_06805 [Phycisphaeraceae bacterium]|nr:hypothetical protein [Phycisphaeraceae bacterium]
MSVLPNKPQDLILFAQTHLSPWQSAAAQIGLTPQQVQEIASATEQASNGVQNAVAARTASKTATSSQNQKVRELRLLLAGAVRNIKATAEGSGNPAEIYDKAEIPAPAPRSPTVPPNRAFDLTAALDYTSGFLTVRWKASQPTGVIGVVYTIARRLGNGTLINVGATGEKKFTDFTVPAGSARVTYVVTAQRGSLVSTPSNALEVNFGVGGPGMSASGFSTRELSEDESRTIFDQSKQQQTQTPSKMAA